MNENKKISPDDEVCQAVAELLSGVEDVDNLELSDKEKEKIASLESSIVKGTAMEIDLDRFLEKVQDNPGSIAGYSETQQAYIIDQLRVEQEKTSKYVNRFSKDALRKKKIEKIMVDLRKKKGMEKFFNEDGSVNDEAVREKAIEEGLEP